MLDYGAARLCAIQSSEEAPQKMMETAVGSSKHKELRVGFPMFRQVCVEMSARSNGNSTMYSMLVLYCEGRLRGVPLERPCAVFAAPRGVLGLASVRGLGWWLPS